MTGVVMKNRFWTGFLYYFVLFNLIAGCPLLAQVSGDDFSNAVFAELNKVRENPGLYVHYLLEMRSKFEGKNIRDGNILLRTNEGVKAVDEAIAFLKKAEPLPAFELSRGMSLAALDHVKLQGKTGKTGHKGADGSKPDQRLNRYGKWYKSMGENIAYGDHTPHDVVLDLIIDDGVPGRGHRTNIFNPDYTKVGVAYGPHTKYGSMCVITFAGDYREK